eukprot:scaffold430965_cov24-Prasinocladus_malaysianus.AAC.1
MAKCFPTCGPQGVLDDALLSSLLEVTTKLSQMSLGMDVPESLKGPIAPQSMPKVTTPQGAKHDYIKADGGSATILVKMAGVSQRTPSGQTCVDWS